MPLRQPLTMRYSIALLLIASVMTVTYITLLTQVKLNEQDAYIINISGQQRMLSQRIALFSREIFHADTVQEADVFVEKMITAVERMVSNHNQLISGNLLNGKTYLLSPNIKKLYFSDPGVHKQVDHYTNLAKELLALYEREGLQGVRNSNHMDQITVIARNGLLSDLNSVVTSYQKEAEAKINRFKMYETAFYILGLIILVLEVLFIFRPMVRQIVTKTNELSNTNAQLTEFTYRISHDLRSPITSSLGLIGVSKMFLEQGEKEKVSESLNHMQTSLERLEVLIEDVITLTKMKQVEIEAEEIKIEELIQNTLENLSNMADFGNVEVRTSIQIEKPIYSKELFLQQTLENVISNAIKYQDPEKNAPFIEIEAYEKENNCIISVKDNGIGIPDKYHEKMFGMFQRFHPSVSFGSGLGLYLVSQNVKVLNGIIKYVPKEDGSEFIVEFPLTNKKI